MNSSKPFWASTTLWGAVAAFVGILLPGLGLNVEPTAVTNFFSSLQQMLDSVLTFGGLALTVYGRARAKHELTLTRKS